MARRWKKLFTRRTWVQLVCLAALNPLGLVSLKWLCLPVFNCHSCPWAATGCPIGALAKFSVVGLAPLLVVGTVGVVAAIGGRVLCAWVCPFGLLQDVLGRVPLPKFSLPRLFRFVKYAVLIFGVVLVPYLLTEESQWFFCRLCPVGTLQAAVPARVLAWARGGQPVDEAPAQAEEGEAEWCPIGGEPARLPWLRYAILGALVVWMMFTIRPFCRYLCPLGALLALFNRISLWRMGVDRDKCTQCGRCGRQCLMDIELYRDPGSAECIRCMECDSCEAISSRWA